MYQRILMPIDASSCSRYAVEEGLQLAKALTARVTFLYVLDPYLPPVPPQSHEALRYVQQVHEDLRRAADEAMQASEAKAKEAGVPATSEVLEMSRPVDGILEAAADHDLIVMGSHGRTGVSRFLLGSVTEGVARHSDIPVLVVRCP